MSAQSDPTYPGGFPAILKQMDGRRAPFVYGPGEALPALDADLSSLMQVMVDKTSPAVAGSRSTFARKFRELSEEFDAQPELLLLHGLLIANLRRTDQPPHTAALFIRLWAEQPEYLLRHLDARWLVSAVTTFGDHGATEVQRRIGQSMTVLFGMMKLYETERLFSGSKPDQPFAWKKRAAKRLPLEMDAYAIAGGGLDVNLLGRLWQDAGEDAVIVPLARHLLDLLIHDPGGVFRRLRIMRARRAKQQAAEGVKSGKADTPDPVTLPIPSELIKTQADSVRWGTVSLVKAPLARLARFAAYHLDLGADLVTLYLDDPDPKTAAFLAQNPRVQVISCDDAWWDTQKKPRMKAHQIRQTWVATQCYNSTDLDWLAHIDVDEFLLPDKDLRDILAAAPKDCAALVMPPVEMLSGAQPEQFKRTPRMAGQHKSVLQTLYPTFGTHLRGGFISHLEGKLIARTGLEAIRFGLHGLTHQGALVENRQRSDDILLGHAHAPDWETFKAHLDFRMTKGSYRKSDSDAFKLRDVLEFLTTSEGEEGLRAFFTEVCEATPSLTAKLDELGMLITRPLDLDAAVDRHFGPLPPEAAHG